ncbi:MAG: hypothetical protein ACOVN0_04290 [Niveispirillum sp.]|uniref:hypothetical protein n=1 Tax=Niveispirillum sp. TaxID=1917217 RepID=UPI003BA72345
MSIALSQLPIASALAGGEAIPVVQSGQTRRTDVNSIRSGCARLADNNSFTGQSVWTSTHNWNYSPLVLRRALSNTNQAKQIAFLLDGDGASATTGTSWSLFLRHSATICAGATSSASTHLEWLGPGEYRINGVSLSASGILPVADGSGSLGSASRRWSDVWAANGAIQTSDRNDKRDISPLPDDLGLSFIEGLSPVLFRFRDEVQAPTTDIREIQRPKTAWIETQVDILVQRDGKWLLVPETRREERPVTHLVPLHDQHGLPLTEEDGSPRLVEVPVMKTAMEEFVVEPGIDHRHHRLHAGLLAQDVQETLRTAGFDLGLFVEDQQTGRVGLRHSELFAPLIKAVQVLAQRLTALETAISAG